MAQPPTDTTALIEVLTTAEVRRNRRLPGRRRLPERTRAEGLWPVNLPHFVAPFALLPTDKVFCIGSCFARELEAALDDRGFTVLSRSRGSEVTAPALPMNKYTIGAILHELQLALEPHLHDVAQNTYEVRDHKFADYLRGGDAWLADEATLKAQQNLIQQIFARVAQADVVVLTLGLSEAWFDTATNRYLNVAPNAELWTKQPERFQLRVLGLDETLTQARAVLTLLDRYLKPGYRLLLSVSPVPLLQTFRHQDITVANSYSKAVLRCAAEVLRMERPDIGYFPSYEMAMTSDPRLVWADTDFRHINRDFAHIIVAHVLSGYAPEIAERHAEATKAAMARLLARSDTAAPPQRNWMLRLEDRYYRLILTAAGYAKYRRDRRAFYQDMGRWFRARWRK